MGSGGRAVAAVLLAATAVLGGAVGAPGAVAAAPEGGNTGKQARAWLPEPSGPYPIGTTALRLTDAAREDPWQPGRRRELMVSLWYPTARPAGPTDSAPYMAPAAGEHFGGPAGVGLINYGTAPGRTDWSAIRTPARADAPALPGGPRPVVLYSPGLGDPRTWGTALVEDLVSRGYVVVTVDHTYEASEVAFPDGELATSVLPGMLGQPDLDIGAVLRKLMATRVDDTRFVLDQLAGLGTRADLPSGVAGALDLDRIGMVGHSAGGFTALQTMHDDRRITAGINLDGQMHFPGPDGHTGVQLPSVAEDGLDRPFLLMGTRSDDSGSYHQQPGWDALWQHSTGWHADLTLEGSRHGSYTDGQSLLPQLARQGALTPDQLLADVGTIRPGRAELATRWYVASFFDRWLRGHDDHLLDGPSPRFPEMSYER
ncbi:alpha/beta hydrolase family protein [Streptomyces sp. 1331.2]|uniref:alpha/beta hydrolase family protein n=1 Tax=Streptomyces sp. 1331.2 TaxID=1938835 RepID=UPI000BD42F3C|nr:esterase [Streptomyces sp. 1331.2]SOB85832.1 Platelet-activating factor acetylhydrolase, isoform II [Streptomyces sp. 1331.2]